MKKTTAAILFGCLISLVVYVSMLSVELVHDLNSGRSLDAYSSEASGDAVTVPKLEVATAAAKSDGRAQEVKATKHHRTRGVQHRQRIKAHQDGVTLML